MSEQKHTPESFGYFKAEPFGWTDCAETDDCAIPLYDEEAISAISKQRDSFKDAAEYNKRRAEYAEKQRDELLATLEEICWSRPLGFRETKYSLAVEKIAAKAIASVKGGAA